MNTPPETDDQRPAERESSVASTDSTREYVDSFKIEMDSLMDANIKLSPIYKHEIITGNYDAVTKFSELAKASRGKMKILVNSDLVAKELVHTINTISTPQSDLLLLIDKTGSMGADIEVIRHSVRQIIDTIKKYKGTRLAVAFYGDKNVDGMTWYKFRNYETDYDAAMKAIDDVVVDGGGDWPESVYEAIMESLNKPFWTSTKRRNIILIGDAPPLEKPLSEYGIDDVIARAKSGGMIMNFYPIIITPTVEAAKVEKSELVTYQPIKLASSVYPNPCAGVLNVGFDECDKYYMEIYNAAGQEIASEEAYGIHWEKNLGDIPNGFYILRIINSEHKFELVKFIVKR